MTWINTSKPTTSGWTSLNPTGRTQYDQSTVIFDDPNVFYDGSDPAFWTKVGKPSGGSQGTILVGMATGLITSPTYAIQHNVSSDSWTKVPKPN